MKLNLDLTELKRSKNVKKNSIGKIPKYSSPIGWWKVTTDGDCEGRSTTQLGNYYGHVAEIAFYLADKAMYDIKFEPLIDAPAPKEISTYTATKDSVWIQLGIESGTWNLPSSTREDWFRKWLQISKPAVTIQGSLPNCSYFGAVHLSLPK